MTDKKIDVSGCPTSEKLFHNEEIRVYETKLHFKDIKYWKKNLRTLLAFDILKEKFGDLNQVDRKEVTSFLSKRSELELAPLAKSIKENGVRIPLIIKDDRTLLDGNRRYFACSLLDMQSDDSNYPDKLKEIPVWVVKSEDLDETRELKIIAEANFVKDLKVQWPLDVRAKVIRDLFNELTEVNCNTAKDAYREIEQIYSLKKNEAEAFVETMTLVDEFLIQANGDKEKEFKLREVVLKKFVYFWEFRDKVLRGRGALDGEELAKVKKLFFQMMELGRFNNIKEIVPMVRTINDEDLWAMLEETKGTNIKDVVALYNAEKAVKSSEDKVRNFLKWYQKQDAENLSRATKSLLTDLAKIISEEDD